ncbi:MAG: MerR family DNA-binding transcriptional regulator [Proteobacteria bacterium]|nr:MAG: MerR family DNA-binding transcriptional regulator [Pseudomonadota bacterium]
MYVSIGEAVLLLGVSVNTLRRWEADGTLLPNYRQTSAL